MVYCGLYPVENAVYDDLKDALENCSLTMPRCLQPETSALGFGFAAGSWACCMEIIKERLNVNTVWIC